MKKLFVISILAVTVALSGCTTMPDGSTAYGMPGSLVWYATTTPEQRGVYLQARCEDFGFKPYTDEMTECMKREVEKVLKARTPWPSSSSTTSNDPASDTPNYGYSACRTVSVTNSWGTTKKVNTCGERAFHGCRNVWVSDSSGRTKKVWSCN